VLVIVRPLRNVTDETVNIHVPDLLAEDVALARSRIDDAKKHLDSGCLTGPVWTEKAEYLSFLYMKIEMVDDVDLTGAGFVALR
jgi:hypothetical protein